MHCRILVLRFLKAFSSSVSKGIQNPIEFTKLKNWKLNLFLEIFEMLNPSLYRKVKYSSKFEYCEKRNCKNNVVLNRALSF